MSEFPIQFFQSNYISLLAFPSARGILAVVCALGIFNQYALRVNLSVALVAMVSCSYSEINGDIAEGG